MVILKSVMNSSQAKKILIVDLLQTLNYKPTKETSREAWYLSPFRSEQKASFKVAKDKNLWYDFGAGEGGTTLDLAQKLFHTPDLSDTLKALDRIFQSPTPFSFHQQSDFFTGDSDKENTDVLAAERKIQIVGIESLHSKGLFDYLDARRINRDIATYYLKEISFTANERSYFALGFVNDKKGYELRNKYYQGCFPPKHFTTIRLSHQPTSTVNLFEGFLDFLSYLTYFDLKHPKEDTIVLNSLSFAKSVIEITAKYQNVNLYLDNDKAGKEAVSLYPNGANFADRIYPNHKDFNDFLCNP